MLYGTFNVSNSMINEYNGKALDAIFAHPGMLALAHSKELNAPDIKVVHCADTQPLVLTVRTLITINGIAAEMFGEEK